MHEIPKTLLPVISADLFHGVIGSKNESLLSDVYQRLAIVNPSLFLYISAVIEQVGVEGAACALMTYHLLETQAECDELAKEFG